MGKAIKILIIIALFFTISCSGKAEQSIETSNSEFKAEMLFEVDGIRVYRFFDAGTSIYFVDVRGSTTWSTTELTGGKTTVTRQHRVESTTQR